MVRAGGFSRLIASSASRRFDYVAYRLCEELAASGAIEEKSVGSASRRAW
jgi:hypothetical protein